MNHIDGMPGIMKGTLRRQLQWAQELLQKLDLHGNEQPWTLAVGMAG